VQDLEELPPGVRAVIRLLGPSDPEMLLVSQHGTEVETDLCPDHLTALMACSFVTICKSLGKDPDETIALARRLLMDRMERREGLADLERYANGGQG